MSDLYLATVPVRAEQYRAGMSQILGRPVLVGHSQTTFAPHTLRCVVEPGDWVVENGERLVNLSGSVARQGEMVVVLSDAKFRRRYRRLVSPARDDATD